MIGRGTLNLGGRNSSRSAALVIVDRTADLLTPAAPHDGYLARATVGVG